MSWRIIGRATMNANALIKVGLTFLLANVTGSCQNAPVITTQPQAQNVSLGSDVVFSVSVSGPDPDGFQWLKNAAPIPNATNSFLFLPNISGLDRGAYSVYVTNVHGMALSVAATLAVATNGIFSTNDVVAVAASGNYSFIAKSDGTLWGVGATPPGSLNLERNHTPMLMYYDVCSVATSPDFYLVGKTDKTLWGKGYCSYILSLRTYYNSEYPARRLATNVVASAAGLNHALFIKSDGTLWAMGLNDGGQLGDGTTTVRETPVKVSSNVVAIAAGNHHSFFVKPDRTLWGMGLNASGQLGDGTTVGRKIPVLVSSNVAAITASKDEQSDFSLFIKTDGTLWGMGENYYGQLGDGTRYSRTLPVFVTSNVVSVTAAATASYFIKADGTLWASGMNMYGQLGDATTEQRIAPVQIASNVVGVAGGSYYVHSGHALFVKDDGSLWGMGYNAFGQLGDGTPPGRMKPVHIAHDVTTIAGGQAHSMFIKKDGTLWAMGDNHFGQLGDDTLITQSSPVKVADGVTAIAAGGSHSLFVSSNTLLFAMGCNYSGQLGTGTTNYRTTTPAFVASNAVTVAAGGYGSDFGHSLFVKKDGTLWGMGNNATYQLGDRTTITRTKPILIDYNVMTVATAGYYGQPPFGHSLFIKTNYTLWRMGDSYHGNLGGGSYPYEYPWQLTNDVKAITAGMFHNLYVKLDGTLWALGRNNNGQLGNGTTNDSSKPVFVCSNVCSVAAGTTHSLFLKNDSTLWGMGLTSVGQLGVGSMNVSPTEFITNPILMASNVVALTAGSGHSLFLKQDGTLWGVGAISSGQLGIGFIDYDPVPHLSFRPPRISLQPESRICIVGDPVTFQIVAIGPEPLFFQWRKNGQSLPGETNDNFTLPSTGTSDTASYDAIVSNDYGVTTSTPASLQVSDRPQLNPIINLEHLLTLQIFGTPMFPYILQTTTNLAPPVNWVSIITNVADSNGLWSFTDTNIPTFPARFYRITKP